MKRRGIVLSSVLALGLVLAACGSGAGSGHVALGANAARAATVDPQKASQLRETMRKLWEDHIAWTRLFIVSAAADLPDRDATAERLLRNQEDIGDAIKPYYGDDAGEQLTRLLREHILIAADLLGAAKTGDDAGAGKARTAWYRNADDIAAFLAEANPDNWPHDAVRTHMQTHLDLTLEEAVSRLQGAFADDIAAYDKIHDAILQLSDALAARHRRSVPRQVRVIDGARSCRTAGRGSPPPLPAHPRTIRPAPHAPLSSQEIPMSENASIKATDNGPLIVKGPFTILDGAGRQYAVGRAVVALCRCGHSQNKPFCDGSHTRVAFRNEARVKPDELDRTA